MITKTILLAVMMIESGNNPNAVSSSNCKGLMQLSSIGEKEVCKQYGCIEGYDVWDPLTNATMGYQLLSHYLDEAKGDVIGAIVLYNSGYVGYRKYLLGEPLSEETTNYIIKFKKLRKHYATLFSRIPGEVPKYYELLDSVVADDPFDVDLLSRPSSY